MLLDHDLLVLEVEEFIVNLLNVHFCPEDVKVAIDAVHDCVVQTIEFLKKVELLLDSSDVLVLGDWHSKELFSTAVCLVPPPKLVKTSLKQVKQRNSGQLNNGSPVFLRLVGRTSSTHPRHL